MIIANLNQYDKARHLLQSLSSEEEEWHTVNDAINVYKEGYVGKVVSFDKICIYPNVNKVVYLGIEFSNLTVDSHIIDKTKHFVSNDGERLFITLKGRVGSNPRWQDILDYLKLLVIDLELKMDNNDPEDNPYTRKQCISIISSAQLINHVRKSSTYVTFGLNKLSNYDK